MLITERDCFKMRLSACACKAPVYFMKLILLISLLLEAMTEAAVQSSPSFTFPPPAPVVFDSSSQNRRAPPQPMESIIVEEREPRRHYASEHYMNGSLTSNGALRAYREV
jgi:hypothetical protein